MNEDLRAPLSGWLRPALLSLDSTQMDRCEGWIDLLANNGDIARKLVLAAHNKFTPGLVTDIESVIRDGDATYGPVAKQALTSRLAAVALLEIMLAGGAKCAEVALGIGSANFMGMKPVIRELGDAAKRCIADEGAKCRSVLPTPLSTPTRRRKPAETDPAEDNTAASNASLRKELSGRDANIAALNKRLDDAVSRQARRDEVAAERLDILWWVQSDASTAGVRWSDMAELDRGVVAGYEFADLLRHAPASEDQRSWLSRVVGAVDSLHDVKQLVDALLRHRDSLPLTGAHLGDLMPLAAAAEAVNAAATTDTGEAAVARLTSLGLDRSWRTTPLDVAMQIVVEQSLEMISS